MLKVDYLKNEKSFRSEIKSIFPCFARALFYTYKQTSKNVVDTTFKVLPLPQLVIPNRQKVRIPYICQKTVTIIQNLVGWL